MDCIRVCTCCHQEKPQSDFARRQGGDGWRRQCRECRRRRASQNPAQATKTTARRRRNGEFVRSVRSQTVCAECGGQPVDWHREEHVEHPHWRVAYLSGQTSSVARIGREIAACTPLCRRCHMEFDGRMERLRACAERRNQAARDMSRCKRGHPYNERDTYVLKGVRYCRVCKRLRRRYGGAGNIPPQSPRKRSVT